MDKEANLFLYELYKKMSVDVNSPYLNLRPEEFYKKYPFLFEFYEDNYRGLLSINKDAKILDVGFGYGMFMVYMKMNGFKNICGVEYTKPSVDNARKMGFQAESISDLSEYLKKNPNQFDLIHGSSVVEHLPKYDLIDIFDLFYNSLKDNGKVMAVVPNIASWRAIYSRYMVLGHEVGFTESSLKQIFEVTNFKNVNIFSNQIKFRPRIKNILMIFLQKIFNAIIGVVDYIYLGVNRPKRLGQYLIGIGEKKR